MIETLQPEAQKNVFGQNAGRNSPALSVALLTDSDVFAGTERHILELAGELRTVGVKVSIACPGSGALASAARARSIDCLAVEKRPMPDLAAIRTLRAYLASGSVDVIHAHNGRTSFLAATAVQMAKRGALVTTQHFLSPSHATRRGLRGVLSRAAHRWLLNQTQQVIAVSQAAGEAMQSRNTGVGGKLNVIPNGISAPATARLKTADQVRREFSVPPGAPLIVCVARLEPEKDIAALIAAMSDVVKALPDSRCLIAGEGSLHKGLEEQVTQSGLTRNVALTGFLDDALSLTGAADLFVLPSLAEPFGLVLLEAMALGKAVISTAAGGPLEIVEKGTTGLLVSPASPGELAAAISSLLSDPERRCGMGERGRARFQQKFTAGAMARSTARVYEVAAKRANARAC